MCFLTTDTNLSMYTGVTVTKIIQMKLQWSTYSRHFGQLDMEIGKGLQKQILSESISRLNSFYMANKKKDVFLITCQKKWRVGG